MSIDTSPYRIDTGDPCDLAARPTRVAALYQSDEHYERRLRKRVKRVRRLQEALYADDRHAVLVIFQAMDAAGKDGSIEHVMTGINPQGVSVHAFKAPSAEELDHDFLWRSARVLPRRGHIGVFNRSYYEEVLVVRVHPRFLDAQRLPDRPADLDELWRQRHASIRDHELHLHRNGTRIVKFFLHVSPEEQLRRFRDRADDPDKHWKVSVGDLDEREHWDAYQRAYAGAIAATATPHAPWYVVPADDKRTSRLIVSEVLGDLLEGLHLAPPSVDPAALAEYRQRLDALGA